MKQILLIFIISLLAITGNAQNEGQDFCKGSITGSYFPLTITKKKVIWYDTYYLEELIGQKIINNISYLEYKQTWEDGSVDILYFRKENNSILQYEKCCSVETVRYDQSFSEGKSWKKADGTATYTLISLNTDFKTPFCLYKNLISIKAEFEKITYIFYYQKGYGYVGASVDDKIISCVSPQW